jgi:phospholipid/cholesterol/gamma-HCH transport system substrate-binding protein
MDERVVQFRVGITVLAAVIITGILMLLFGEAPALLRGTYTIYIKFPSAPGVSQDTPVRKSGIRIGRVSKVQFAPDNEVLVTASIDGGIELFRDEAVRIKSGLLGDAELEFVPGPHGRHRSATGLRQHRRKFEPRRRIAHRCRHGSRQAG